MPKFELVKAGDVFFDVGGRNVWHRCFDVWQVRVISVDPVTKTVVASWNHNKPRTYTEKHVEKWRRSNPNDKKKAKK